MNAVSTTTIKFMEKLERVNNGDKIDRIVDASIEMIISSQWAQWGTTKKISMKE